MWHHALGGRAKHGIQKRAGDRRGHIRFASRNRAREWLVGRLRGTVLERAEQGWGTGNRYTGSRDDPAPLRARGSCRSNFDIGTHAFAGKVPKLLLQVGGHNRPSTLVCQLNETSRSQSLLFTFARFKECSSSQKARLLRRSRKDGVMIGRWSIVTVNQVIDLKVRSIEDLEASRSHDAKEKESGFGRGGGRWRRLGSGGDMELARLVRHDGEVGSRSEYRRRVSVVPCSGGCGYKRIFSRWR